MATLAPLGPKPRKGLVDSLGYYYAFLTDPIGFVRDRFDRYGDVYLAPSKDGPLYVLRHPAHIEDVLVRNAAAFGKKHSALAQLETFLGHGLLTTEGDEWRRHRRMVNPAFSKKRLGGYAEVMVDEAAKCVDRWADRERADIGREMMDLTLRVVCRTLFGHDAAGKADRVADAMALAQRGMGRPAIAPAWLPYSQGRRNREAMDNLDAIVRDIVRERRASSEAPDPPDLLQLLLDARDDENPDAQLTDDEVRDHLLTFFVAGHETTSHALTWSWYLLSQHPEVEAALHEEIAGALGDRLPTYDDLPNLPLTGQIFQEAMRLYPPAYSVARGANEDTFIGEYAIPKGSEVVIWIYMTHHDPRWWPKPERFDPSRFAPDAVARRPKLAYLPFGAGARACIGKIFAMIEGQLLMATIAQRYRLRLVPGHRVVPQPRITLGQKYGMMMTTERR